MQELCREQKNKNLFRIIKEKEQVIGFALFLIKINCKL